MTFLTRVQRWNPFDELATLRNELDRLTTRMRTDTDDVFAADWAPATDVIEKPDAMVFRTELPGLKEKYVAVQIENNMLTIRGERKMEEETKEKDFVRIERGYGKFVRAFTLPNNMDAEKIEATFDNGLLEVKVPRKAEAMPKTVKLNVKTIKAA